MTIAFWFVYGALLFAWVIQIVVTQRWRRLAHELTDDLVEAQSGLVEAEKKHAEYRAAYRDLLDDYTRLHTAYKEHR